MTKQDIIERAKCVSFSSNPKDYIDFVGELTKENETIPADVAEAATEFANQDCVTFISRKKGFIAGAQYERERLMKEAVEGTLGYGPHLLRPIVMLEQVPKIWDGSSSNPVSVIIIKKEK